MNKPIPIHYFSDIPNDEEGAEFIRLARKFLNRKRYKIRKLGRGTRKVNGAKNSYRYSASLPHQFSERFSLYIDDFIDNSNNLKGGGDAKQNDNISQLYDLEKSE